MVDNDGKRVVDMLDEAAPPAPTSDELAAAEDAAVLNGLGEANANDEPKKKKGKKKAQPAALETRRDEIRSLLTREL